MFVVVCSSFVWIRMRWGCKPCRESDPLFLTPTRASLGVIKVIWKSTRRQLPIVWDWLAREAWEGRGGRRREKVWLTPENELRFILIIILGASCQVHCQWEPDKTPAAMLLPHSNSNSTRSFPNNINQCPSLQNFFSLPSTPRTPKKTGSNSNPLSLTQKASAHSREALSASRIINSPSN
jgi:hypothetical protein